MIINTQFYTKYVRACSMFYHEGYRSVTPLDAARVKQDKIFMEDMVNRTRVEGGGYST